jgi:hypothetical protein
VNQLFDTGKAGIVERRRVQSFGGLDLFQTGFELCDIHSQILTAGLHGIQPALIGSQRFVLSSKDLVVAFDCGFGSLKCFEPLCEVGLDFGSGVRDSAVGEPAAVRFEIPAKCEDGSCAVR